MAGQKQLQKTPAKLPQRKDSKNMKFEYAQNSG
jgi:hypothetical protein